MKRTLFPRLAANGIRKNRKLYRPYILACSGMATLVYILAFLGNSEMVNEMSAGRTLSIIMRLGSWVLAIFSCISAFIERVAAEYAPDSQIATFKSAVFFDGFDAVMGASRVKPAAWR